MKRIQEIAEKHPYLLLIAWVALLGTWTYLTSLSAGRMNVWQEIAHAILLTIGVAYSLYFIFRTFDVLK